jgi:preprotein translocase subunit SecY
MNTFFNKASLLLKDPSIQKRILFMIGALALYRLGASIPIPGVDANRLSQFLSGNTLFGFLNIFSGGGLSNLSVFMLGVGPYITGSIIMQLLTMIFPSLKKLYHEEGDAGRKRFAQYSRLLTVPLALIQGFALLGVLGKQQILGDITPFDQLLNVFVVTTGAVLLMWIGEMMTEYGIGNGTSLLIFAGIIAGFPSSVGQLLFTFDPSQIPLYVAFIAIAVVVIAGVVVVTEAERPIQVTYAKRIRGMKVYGGASTYLPLRLNQAGVIPIIFALSILLFPQIIGSALTSFANPTVQAIGSALVALVSNMWVYGIFYFILVFLFTYFYTAVTFDPDAISENLQKSGAFISGVRPGKPTSAYLSKVITRLTLVGASFLGVIAVMPLVVQAMSGLQALAIGGTSLLIVVSVILELIRQMEAQASMREY